jgi:phospholipase/carboxylesterase
MTRLMRAGAGGATARIGLVLLHGRGAGAEDILGLGAALGLPDVAMIAPEAPGRSWWPSSFLAPMGGMAPYVTRGLAAVDEAIATLEAEGLTRDRIVLAGFSQGGCLALEYGVRRGGLAGIFGLSAGLVGTSDAMGGPDPALYGATPKRLNYDTDLTGLPVTITVHERDPHIPLKRAQDSADAFRALGASVRLHVAPGAGHAVTETGITDMRAILNS